MASPKKVEKFDKDLCRIITSEARLSYPHLFKAQAPKAGDKLKFSATFLFPKDKSLVGTSPPHPVTAVRTPRSLKDVMRNAKLAKFGPKENWPEDLESPVVDGDDPKFKDKDGYKGHWVIKATTNEDQRPGVVDHNNVTITDPAELYPGCYVSAYVYAYVWEYMGRQGVGFILDGVQKLRDGKSFGGKKPVEQVFAPHVQPDDEADDSEDEDDDTDFI